MKMPPQVLSVTAFFLFQKNFPLCVQKCVQNFPLCVQNFPLCVQNFPQNFPLLNEKLGEFANISKDLQSTN